MEKKEANIYSTLSAGCWSFSLVSIVFMFCTMLCMSTCLSVPLYALGAFLSMFE